MRFISVAGILLLLLLQYFWVRNAYRMVEGDLMEKSKECLREAVNGATFNALERITIDVGKEKIKDTKSIDPNREVLGQFEGNDINDFNLSFQFLLEKTGKSYTLENVDSIFTKMMTEKYGFVPDHKLNYIDNNSRFKFTKELIINKNKNIFALGKDSIEKEYTCKINDLIYGDKVYLKLNSTKSIMLDITSPTLSVITKARYIFIVSILLVLLLGIILIFQYKSMLKDKEFGVFLKDFSRVLAHELRTPINDIYLLISTVLAKDFTDGRKIEQYQKESLNQCSKMLLSIDNILLIAKSELSKISVLKSQVDMRLHIEKIVDKYRNHFFMGKTVNIETLFLTEDCKAFIDPELMENAMINLIENAIKYSYEKVTICIICSVENNHLLLRVKDDGFGISKSNMKNIFKIFGRGSKMDYRQIKGFGIGLFYVQKVILAHKGKIEVISEEGSGSEFFMDIPSRF